MDWKAFYEPIADVDKYLRRFGIMKREEPTRDYLDRLIKRHQVVVPYENLDITQLKRPISLKTKDLYHKIVENDRGGTSFELNGLFVMLLQELGYQAYSCEARVLLNHEEVPVPAAHRGIIVLLDGKRLYCDVGFAGPIVAGCIDLDNDQIQTIEEEAFRVVEKDGWYTFIRYGKADAGTYAWDMTQYDRDKDAGIAVMSVSPVPHEPVDFCAPALLCSTGETALTTRIASHRTTGGYCTFIGNMLTDTVNGSGQKSFIYEDQIEEMAQLYFGISFDE